MSLKSKCKYIAITLFISAFVPLFCGCLKSKTSEEPLQLRTLEDKTFYSTEEIAFSGIRDLNLNFIIEPEFNNAGQFSEGLGPVMKDKKYGYINKNGKYVIQSQYLEARPFYENLAAVQIKDKNKFGFIDKTGKVIIEPQYYSVDRFSQGLCAVSLVKNDLKGYINKTGKMVIPPKFVEAGPFVNALAPIKIQGNWGYIDPEGKIQITPVYQAAGPFSQELASVAVDNLIGFIDKTGKIVISPQYLAAGSFSEDLAPVAMVNTIIETEHSTSNIPDNTFTSKGDPLKERSLIWGYIDKTGKVVIPIQYEDAHPFKMGLAAVKKDDKWGYINKSGKFVYMPQFETASSFNEGLAVASLNGRYGYIANWGDLNLP